MDEQDFYNITINVQPYPKLAQSLVNDSGESTLRVKDSAVPERALTIIVQPDGLPLYPQNQFLYSLLKDGKKSTETDAQALLAFQRFLTHQNKTYKSITDEPEEGAPWLFADHLLSNLKVINPATAQVLRNPEGYSLSSARTYIDVVIRFYKWLHRSGLLYITRDNKPFEFEEVTLRRDQSVNNHDLLGHLSNKRKAITVQTTSLKKRFPKIQSTPPHLKLKPMSVEDKKIFLEHLKCNYNQGYAKTIGLMLRFAIETGLRVGELVTFPANGVHYPMTNSLLIPFTIGPANGCETKFTKQRDIQVPYSLMLELDEYLHKEGRDDLLTKGVYRMRQEHQQEMEAKKTAHKNHGILGDFKESKFVASEHVRLFISAHGLPYSKSTIQAHMSLIRTKIRKTHPNWYYRIHDLRSTFATYWLEEQTEKRGLVFDLLMQELASLMGHESTLTTEKYTNFMNDKQAKLGYASRKNKAAQDAFGAK